MLSAQDRALLMPEVLEIILLQLPLKDLLINAQRVNQFFHNVIASSRYLQQALFFRPIRDASVTKVRTNPLLRKKFPPWFEDKQLMPRAFALADHKHFWRLDWNGSKERAEAYARREASWRHMLVAQPPVHDLIVKMRTEATSGPRQSKGELKPEDGLRMGLFYDIVQDFVEHQPVTYFVIQWYLPPTFGYVDGELSDPEEGDIRSFITIHLRQVIQSQSGMTGKIGPEFKSLAYEPIEIDYCPVFREPLSFYAYCGSAMCLHCKLLIHWFRNPAPIGYCLFILNILADTEKKNLAVKACGISCEYYLCQYFYLWCSS
jgi:hypothetical protein